MNRIIFRGIVILVLTSTVHLGQSVADSVPVLQVRPTPSTTAVQPLPGGIATTPQPKPDTPAVKLDPRAEAAPAALVHRSVAETMEQVRNARGGVVLVHIWGAFCPPCREEFPVLIRLAERYRSQPFEIVACACDVSPVTTAQFLKDREMNFTCTFLTDRDYTPFREAGINISNKVPFTAILDSSGKVVKEWSGSRDYKTYCGILDETFCTAAPVTADLPALTPPRKKVPVAGPEVKKPVEAPVATASPSHRSAESTVLGLTLTAGLAFLGLCATMIVCFRR